MHQSRIRHHDRRYKPIESRVWIFKSQKFIDPGYPRDGHRYGGDGSGDEYNGNRSARLDEWNLRSAKEVDDQELFWLNEWKRRRNVIVPRKRKNVIFTNLRQ